MPGMIGSWWLSWEFGGLLGWVVYGGVVAVVAVLLLLLASA